MPRAGATTGCQPGRTEHKTDVGVAAYVAQWEKSGAPLRATAPRPPRLEVSVTAARPHAHRERGGRIFSSFSQTETSSYEVLELGYTTVNSGTVGSSESPQATPNSACAGVRAGQNRRCITGSTPGY